MLSLSPCWLPELVKAAANLSFHGWFAQNCEVLSMNALNSSRYRTHVGWGTENQGIGSMQLFPIAVNQLDGNLLNLGVGYGPGTVRNSVGLRLGMPVARVIDHTNPGHVLLLLLT